MAEIKDAENARELQELSGLVESLHIWYGSAIP